MANKHVNKVVYGDDTLIDLTGDTVSPETLSRGVTAHNAAGEQIAGVFDGIDTSDADAAASDILDGKTAYVNGEKITGTLEAGIKVVYLTKEYDTSAFRRDLDAMDVGIGEGYFDRLTNGTYATAKAAIDDGGIAFLRVIFKTNGIEDKRYDLPLSIEGTQYLTTGYIESFAFSDCIYKAGIQPKNGTPNDMSIDIERTAVVDTDDADAVAADILNGKTAYVNGEKVEGIMPDNTGWTETLNGNKTSVKVPQGYHDGEKSVSLDFINSDTFTPTKSTITKDYTAFPKQVVVNPIPDEYITTTDADATAADILDGKTAYVNGEKLTGTAQSTAPYEINVNMEDLTFSDNTALHKYGTKTLPAGSFEAAKNAFDNNAKAVLNVYQSGEKIAICGLLNYDYSDSPDENILYGSVAGILNDALVQGYADLRANDVVSIEVIVVNDTSNATATAADILDGKTAYVQGVEITGTLQNASGVSF